MAWIAENWMLAIALLALAASLYLFAWMPSEKQAAKAQEWLLYAVSMAEKELGSGTGRLKLRQVYGMFIEKFPRLARTVSFETFSEWVDCALDEMRKMLEQNKAAADFIGGSG